MKHQVFFFLSIFSFPVYSMDKNEQVITAVCSYCSSVNYYFPDVFNVNDVRQVKKEIKSIMREPSLTQEEKVKIVLQGLDLLPRMIMVGNRPVLLDSNEKNKYSANNRIY